MPRAAVTSTPDREGVSLGGILLRATLFRVWLWWWAVCIAAFLVLSVAQSWLWVLPAVGLAVWAWWRRTEAALWRYRRQIIRDWVGTRWRPGLAAALGLVVPTTKAIPKISRIDFSPGRADIQFSCPPGLPTSQLIDVADQVKEAFDAVEIVMKPVRGTSTVEAALVFDDPLARDVAAPWIVDSPEPIDPFAEGEIEFVGDADVFSSPPLSPAAESDAVPYWESTQPPISPPPSESIGDCDDADRH